MQDMIPAFLIGILLGAALMVFFSSLPKAKQQEEEKIERIFDPPVVKEEKFEVTTVFAGVTIPRGYEHRPSSMVEEDLMRGLGREVFRFADIRQREDKIMGVTQIEAAVQIVVRDNFNPFVDSNRCIIP